MRKNRGLTFIELVISLAILGILAAIALPLSEIAVKRSREMALRTSLREIRQSLDKYKDNYDKGVYGAKIVGASGYPKTLQDLIDKKILRRIPPDPIAKTAEWGTRSFSDRYDSIISDKTDVYDVFSASEEIALDGSKYSSW